MINSEKTQKEFPITKKMTYLNTAATSPLPVSTIQTINTFLHERAGYGEERYDSWLKNMEQARKTVADLINVQKQEISFLKNTGEGINTIAYALPWKKEDEIVLCDLEFPSNYTPWEAICDKYGTKMKVIEAKKGYVTPEEVNEAISNRTKLVTISFVQYSSGAKMPLKEIIKVSHDYNCKVLVDAIQGIGALEFDNKQIKADFIACGGHKWLVGPLGVGFLYVKREIAKQLDPPFRGWLNYDPLDSYALKNKTFANTGRKFEIGNPAFSNIFGLDNSIKLIQKISVAKIERHIKNLVKMLLDNLIDKNYELQSPIESDKISGIVNFIPKKIKSNEMILLLRKKAISCANRFNGIRVSPHFFNTEKDIQKFIDVVNILDK